MDVELAAVAVAVPTVVVLGRDGASTTPIKTFLLFANVKVGRVVAVPVNALLPRVA